MTDPTRSSSYRFGTFELQPGEHRLLANGEPVALGPRAFDLLVALVERAGQLVTKETLFEKVWPKLIVEENNLQVQISALRKILGQEAITTILTRLPPNLALAGGNAAREARKRPQDTRLGRRRRDGASAYRSPRTVYRGAAVRK
jgi:hypothetical protein